MNCYMAWLKLSMYLVSNSSSDTDTHMIWNINNIREDIKKIHWNPIVRQNNVIQNGGRWYNFRNHFFPYQFILVLNYMLVYLDLVISTLDSTVLSNGGTLDARVLWTVQNFHFEQYFLSPENNLVLNMEVKGYLQSVIFFKRSFIRLDQMMS